MKKTLIVLALIPIVLMLGIGGCTVSTYNTMVNDEEGIRAQEKQIDVAMDKMVKKIQGQGYVVEDFKETLVAVLGETIGAGGRAASGGKFFQAVSESYPTIPSKVWEDMANTMNDEYESFAASQSTKIAKLETYRKHLRRLHYLLAKQFGGFPTIDLEEHDKLILGSEARESRETGVIETIDPFSANKGTRTPQE
jgi:hypothetical protein